jgi:ABC-type dipeptide/oligopeptide/nickel transport system ATPase subunit
MKDVFSHPIQQRGLILHAVAVSAPTGAILLLGHSGAGKSTLGRALSVRFPVMADDNICLAPGPKNSQWFVTDAKMMHTASYRFVPLLAAIRTFQSPVAHLEKIPPRLLCRYLLDALFEVQGMRIDSTKQKKEWFAWLADVARHHPGWRLSATLGPETPQLVFDCFR